MLYIPAPAPRRSGGVYISPPQRGLKETLSTVAYKCWLQLQDNEDR